MTSKGVLMRIAIVNWSRRRAGGAESYLSQLIPALVKAGHHPTLWYQTDEPHDREMITEADTFLMGDDHALTQLSAWSPDVLYCHGLTNPDLESRLLDIAPAVFFAHNYYGTCISGGKTWKFPVARPCIKRFGPACLLHFYPHRCGGLNPVTMFRDYYKQAMRLKVLERYTTILTHSHHMQREFWRHGLSAERVLYVAFPVVGEETDGWRGGQPASRSDGRARLVFLGRMDRLKGGMLLLDALPSVRATLNRPVDVTFVGDGPERAEWERHATRVLAMDPGVTVRFTGWLDHLATNGILDQADLLVFPSLWPEPFGLVGLEAGLRGVPVAAFSTGGIPDWLTDGVNGYMAHGEPPTAEGLVEAIGRCLKDDVTHTRLREGALGVARKFTMAAHLDALLPVLDRAKG